MPSSASPRSLEPSRRNQAAADRRPPGFRRARHLLPRRQPGDEPGGLRRSPGRVRDAIVEAAVTVDIVDVGGGFPSVYPGMEPPALETFFAVIHAGSRRCRSAIRRNSGASRAARCVRSMAAYRPRRKAARRRTVHQRRRLWRAVRCRAHRLALSGPAAARPDSRVRPTQFSFYGPTCDDLDHMAGPFELPGDVGPGDYIEIGMLGAYGCAMRTGFNGFGSAVPKSSMTSRWRASTRRRAGSPVRTS